MSELTSFALEGGLRVTVAASGSGGVTPAGRGAMVTQAERTLKQALSPVTAAASEVIDTFREHASRPDEVEIRFGVQLDGSLGAIIASAGIASHLEVTMRWSTDR